MHEIDYISIIALLPLVSSDEFFGSQNRVQMSQKWENFAEMRRKFYVTLFGVPLYVKLQNNVN